KFEVEGQRVWAEEDVYAQGLGPWDHHQFQQVYGRGIEDEVLAPLTYITDADSRGDDAASADAATWVVPGQAQGSFRHALRVRAAALANFSASTVPPGSDAHDLAHAFTLAYLVHRHETVGLSK